MADLHDLLARHGYQGSPATVYRALERLLYRCQRPRHELPDRQDVEAIAGADHMLVEKEGGHSGG